MPYLKIWTELNPILIQWPELYHILIHWETDPYVNALPNYTLPYYITDLYTILANYLNTLPTTTYPNTLPNYTLSQYITDL